MMTTFELVRAKAEAAHKAAGYGGCASCKNGFYYLSQ